ncbi:MAG: PKD domain-containing protein, partial [Candidatus Latescibacteria bacterium]|nr:PKD domain-containing protein [Candidatus Latescibacterota bacterium]
MITVKAKPTAAIAVLGIIVLALLSGCAALNSPPVASFTCNPSSGESPLTVSFNASSSHDPDGTIVTYRWTFGDGSNGT